MYPSWHAVPSAMGGGLNFHLFGPDTMDKEVLFVTHTIVLSGIKIRRPILQISNNTVFMWSLMREQGRHFPLLESLGLFLMFRGASPACLDLAERCYRDDLRSAMTVILSTRAAKLSKQVIREQKGCGCLDCEPEWLDAGWQCPWALVRVRMRLG
jgi:hypothetical protein